jgi:hypothetical protein
VAVQLVWRILVLVLHQLFHQVVVKVIERMRTRSLEVFVQIQNDGFLRTVVDDKRMGVFKRGLEQVKHLLNLYAS